VQGDGGLVNASWESVAMDKRIPDDPQMANLLETLER
jgi:hypothetical protein